MPKTDLLMPAPESPLSSRRTNRREAKVLDTYASRKITLKFDISQDGSELLSGVILPEGSVVKSCYLKTTELADAATTILVTCDGTAVDDGVAYDANGATLDTTTDESAAAPVDCSGELKIEDTAGTAVSGVVLATIEYFVA